MVYIEQAKECLVIEAEAIRSLIPRLDENFVAAADKIISCKGRVVVTGMGKSGLIGKKIAATLASTGTPSFFLHPAEGIHGDLGMITADDIVLALSNSGETSEVLSILPSVRRIGAAVIALCGQEKSTLGQNADIYLDASVTKEACPLGLAPTASTTAALALGDALAVALLSMRKFTQEDFALFHPGGSLGKKLLLTVEDVMRTGIDIPMITAAKTVKEALFVITDKGLGATLVVADLENAQIIGLVTDGDIRRSLERGHEFLDKPVSELMTKKPKTITKDKLAAHALYTMEKNTPRPITLLPVIGKDSQAIGIIHLTDLLRQGVV